MHCITNVVILYYKINSACSSLLTLCWERKHKLTNTNHSWTITLFLLIYYSIPNFPIFLFTGTVLRLMVCMFMTIRSTSATGTVILPQSRLPPSCLWERKKNKNCERFAWIDSSQLQLMLEQLTCEIDHCKHRHYQLSWTDKFSTSWFLPALERDAVDDSARKGTLSSVLSISRGVSSRFFSSLSSSASSSSWDTHTQTHTFDVWR